MISHDIRYAIRAGVEGGGTRRPVRVRDARDGDTALVAVASPTLFDVLGVAARIGRMLTPDDEVPGAAPAAVLNHRYWKARFGGSADAVGQTVFIQNIAFTIVGVAPPGFFGHVVGESPDLWVPTNMQPRLWAGRDFLDHAGVDWLLLVGRLRPGVGEAQAQADLQAILRGVEQEWKETPKARGLPRSITIEVSTGGRGYSELRERFDRPLRILMGAVGLVLLIAGLNVASLLVARNGARERELAIRVAVGARSRDLARQFVAESLVLSALGGATGLLLGFWGTDALLPLLGDHHGAPIDVGADARLLAFTALVTRDAAGSRRARPRAARAGRDRAGRRLRSGIPGGVDHAAACAAARIGSSQFSASSFQLPASSFQLPA